MGEFLGSEVGTELETCDGMLVWNAVGTLEGSSPGNSLASESS